MHLTTLPRSPVCPAEFAPDGESTLASLAPDAQFDTHACAQHIARWWRAHGGSWHEAGATSTLLAGAAQLAWRCAHRDEVPCAPPFTVTLAAWPRCVRVLLPDDSRHFGAVIVWLSHFESLLPTGAPPCHLVLAARPGEAEAPSHDVWLWGRTVTGEALRATNETHRPAG